MDLARQQSADATRARMAEANAMASQGVPAAQANILSTLYSQPVGFANTLGNTYGTYGQGITGVQQANNAALSSAYGNMAQSLGGMGTGFANAIGQTYGGMSQGLGALGSGLGNAYGAYATGLGNVAQAQANERGNQYSANAMAEAARQGAVGTIGAAALGAYGSAANSALNAWGMNQTSYNKALSDMVSANQMATSNYGTGRAQALGSLGNAYAAAGKGLAGASALSNLNLSAGFGGSPPGSTFSADGTSGPIASGSYGPSAGNGNFFINANRSSNSNASPTEFAPQTFGGLDALQRNMMAQDIPDSLSRNYDNGLGSLNAQHATSRNQPSDMLGQSLGGLLALGGQGYGNAAAGMNQYYRSQPRPTDHTSILDGLASGFRDTSGRSDGLGGRISSGFQGALGQMGSVFDRTSSGITSGFDRTANQLGQSLNNASRDLTGGYNSTNRQIGGIYDNFRQDALRPIQNIFGMTPAERMQRERQQYALDDMRQARRDDLNRRAMAAYQARRARV